MSVCYRSCDSTVYSMLPTRVPINRLIIFNFDQDPTWFCRLWEVSKSADKDFIHLACMTVVVDCILCARDGITQTISVIITSRGRSA